MTRIYSGPLTRAIVLENPDTSLDKLLVDRGFQVDRILTSPSEDELIELLQKGRHQVLFKRSRIPITERIINEAPDLMAIQLCCIGDDSIDKAACARRGVLVFSDPVSNARSVVELFVSCLIGMARRLFDIVPSTLAGDWQKSAKDAYEIRGKRLGVLGLGNIGRQVAKTAEMLGMEVSFYDTRIVAQEVGIEMGWKQAASMEALFAASDAVTVHVSATDLHGTSNEGLLTRDVLMQLGAERPESSPRLFLNLSRGFLHSTEDLIAAYRAGRVRGAAVDVYPEEPKDNGPGWDNPYAGLPGFVTTPHIGAATQDAQPRIAHRVAQTVDSFSRFGSIRDCVFAPRSIVTLAEDAPGKTVLLVLHSTTRGTKKALDDAIYEAGADNLRSEHRDYERWGLAVDANVLDRPLSNDQLQGIIDRTASLTGDQTAVRLVRQIQVP